MTSDSPAIKTAAQRRIVLTAIGSMGDLHPFMAIGLGLKARGHEAIVASGECYRKKIEAAGLGFHLIRPDCDRMGEAEFLRRFMHPQFGLLRIGREWILPALRDSYEDTLAAAADADLLVAHPLAAFSSRLVAEKTGLPWASAMLVPLGFFSAHDLPVLDIVPGSHWLRLLGPAFWRPFLWCSKRATRFVAEPWYRLRREIGLSPTDELNPLGDSHSPQLVLATFSKHFADKQPDWPAQTVVSGFPLYDAGGELPADLVRFLDAGPPPIVFTLGTAVSSDAGKFFEHSVAAARRLGRRAVLTLQDPRNRPRDLPPDVFACDYAPFSLLFLRGGGRASRRDRHDRAGAVRRPADAGHAVRLGSAGPRRSIAAFGRRPRDLSAPLHAGPRRRGTGAIARRADVCRSRGGTWRAAARRRRHGGRVRCARNTAGVKAAFADRYVLALEFAQAKNLLANARRRW